MAKRLKVTLTVEDGIRDRPRDYAGRRQSSGRTTKVGRCVSSTMRPATSGAIACSPDGMSRCGWDDNSTAKLYRVLRSLFRDLMRL